MLLRRQKCLISWNSDRFLGASCIAAWEFIACFGHSIRFRFWETKGNSATIWVVRGWMWYEEFWETSISFYHRRATKNGSWFLVVQSHRRCLIVAWFYVACQREKGGRREFNRGAAVWYVDLRMKMVKKRWQLPMGSSREGPSPRHPIFSSTRCLSSTAPPPPKRASSTTLTLRSKSMTSELEELGKNSSNIRMRYVVRLNIFFFQFLS